MGDDVVGVVRAWLVRLEEGDYAPEMCHPEVTITNWAESPVPGPYHGRDGVARWWADLEDALPGVQFRLESTEQLDETHVLSTQRLVGTFRLTGIDLDWPWGSILEVRDGLIASATGYMSRGDARRAA